MRAYDTSGWSDFGVATAGAGAALAGLLFVVLSINLTSIISGDRLTARSAHTMILFVVPLIIALLLLIPEQRPRALGTELVITGVMTGGWLATLNPPWRRSSHQGLASWIITDAVPALALSTSTVLAGIGMLTGALGGLYWLPVGVITAFAGALLNTWVLLVEILR